MVVRNAVVDMFEEPCPNLVVGGDGGRVLLDSVEHRRPHEGGIIAGDVVDVFSDRTRGHLFGLKCFEWGFEGWVCGWRRGGKGVQFFGDFYSIAICNSSFVGISVVE